MKKLLTLTLSLALALSLAACGGSGGAASSTSGGSGASSSDTSGSDASGAAAVGKTDLTFSKSQGPYSILFDEAIVPILEAQGYTVTAVDMSDLLAADIALNDGDVDFNVEQHTAYIENFNSSNNGDLVGISPIPTVPAGIYSSRHSSVDEIADGATVAVPNDASNMARCYLMLQKVGWITFDPGADVSTLTQDDIIDNPHNIEFVEMTNFNIPPAIDDFDFVAITGSVVYNAGIDPSTALANEDILDHLVLQVTVKAENAGADWAKAIVDAYHSDEFKAYLSENNDGLWWIPAELQ